MRRRELRRMVGGHAPLIESRRHIRVHRLRLALSFTKKRRPQGQEKQEFT